MAPPMVAATVMVSVSWFLTCASSCAITPATSSGVSVCEQPGRSAHRGVRRVAAGGEGIGLRVVHDVDARHRQPGALRQLAHDAVVLRRR